MFCTRKMSNSIRDTATALFERAQSAYAFTNKHSMPIVLGLSVLAGYIWGPGVAGGVALATSVCFLDEDAKDSRQRNKMLGIFALGSLCLIGSLSHAAISSQDMQKDLLRDVVTRTIPDGELGKIFDLSSQGKEYVTSWGGPLEERLRYKGICRDRTTGETMVAVGTTNNEMILRVPRGPNLKEKYQIVSPMELSLSNCLP